MKVNKIIVICGVLSLIFAFSTYSYFYNSKEISNPKVSIVIPVYNTEKYLDKCLDSVENQTLKEIEIICVNDESTDSSVKVLKKHRSKDPRIRIINQRHSGLSAARNTGINAARGEYIAFLDSDDMMLPKAYECIYNSAKEHDAEVIEFKSFNFTDGESVDFNEFSCDELDKIVVQREINDNPFITLSLNDNNVWDKVWKNSFIKENGLKFKEGLPSGEDYLFDWLAFPLVCKGVKSNNIFYIYRMKRPGSIVSTSNTVSVLNSNLIIIEEIFNNHDRFNFPGGEEWTLNALFRVFYNRITNELENQDDKIHFSEKVLGLLDDYLEKYKINLSIEHQKKIDILRSIANGNEL